MKIDIGSIRLRHLARSDAPAIRAAVIDGRISHNTTVPHPYPVGGEYAFIQNCESKPVWAIVGYLDGIETFLGVVGFHQARADFGADIEIGYWVDPTFWNNGIGTKAIKLVIEKNTGLDKIGATVFTDNPASMRVFEKIGFERAGITQVFSAARGHDVETVIYLAG